MKHLIIILLFLLAFTDIEAQPANDFCSNAISLTQNSSCSWTLGTTQNATMSINGCSGNSDDDVWYSFVATTPYVTVDVQGNGDFDAVVEVFSGTCAGLISLSCTDLALGGGLESADVFNLTPGNTYLIRVYDYYNNTAWPPSDWTFNICVYDYTDVCGDFVCGPTESCSNLDAGYCPDDCGTCNEVPGTYLHPTAGLQGTYLGTCMINIDCGITSTYYDNGGAAANYSANINNIYRTFCPDETGKAVTVLFNTMGIQESGGVSCTDYLVVRNGPTQGSPILWAACYDGDGSINLISGSWANPITSTSSSGCLTFQFYSNGTTQLSGWNASLTCSNSAVSQENYDCITADPICGTITFTGSSTGPGLTSTCGGCNLSENFSSWYYFEITSNGRLEMTITPTISTDDYDFALYQTSDCGDLGSPVRCSYASNTGTTGMDMTYSDVSEDVTGDAWVDAVNVVQGQGYFLMVNKWSAGGSGFTIDFTLTDATLDCSIVLPVELTSFVANCDGDITTLNWTTLSEENNDYFIIMKSYDGVAYKGVDTIKGSGNSNSPKHYRYSYREGNKSNVYYKLKQVDYDGKFQFSEAIASYCDEFVREFKLKPNPSNKQDWKIEGLVETDKVIITDIAGKIVERDELINGIYIIIINDVVRLKLILRE